MSGVIYTNRVIVRNNFGRFIADCEQAANETVEDVVTEGAEVAASFAPKRTMRLANSIKPFMITRTSGVWGSNAPYAAAQEKGAVPHPISAYVSFYWHKAGRQWLHPPAYEWITGYPGADPISHPGNPATHFLRDSATVMRPRMVQIAKSRYPG